MDDESEGAFRDFVVGSSSGLQRMAYLLLGDRGEAEDAVQSALTRVYVAWPRIEKRDGVWAYARKVLLREVLSWRRRRRLRVIPVAALPERAGRDELAELDEREVLARALLRLPARQRAVVVLRYYDDLTEAQTAAVLGITTGAVKTHAFRGLGRLREVLSTAREEERRT